MSTTPTPRVSRTEPVIIPVRPATAAENAPAARVVAGLLRRTFGRGNPSRRTFGVFHPSRRTFGLYHPSRRTFGVYHP
jgi:hypothetical protein